MADNPVKVSLLDGDFARISAIGFPLAVAVQLQQMDLKFAEALWTARHSGSGFSVSLFWPTIAAPPVLKKKNKRRRKKNRKGTVNGVSSVPGSHDSVGSLTLIDAHHEEHVSSLDVANKVDSVPDDCGEREDSNEEVCGEREDSNEDVSFRSDSGSESEHSDEVEHSDEYCSDEEVKLAECNDVKFEMREDSAGVSFSKDGEVGWTPVKHRRRKCRREIKSSDDEDIFIPKGASVSYMKTGRTPYLLIATKRTRAGYPIASRTRKQDRVCYKL